MRISVIGLGYVGLVTSACLARLGHDVIGVDVDADRVARLSLGRVPFHEPGIDELVAEGLSARRLRFTTDTATAAKTCQAMFIAVGTHDGNGGWQSATIESALRTFVPLLPEDAILVVRSTLPPDFAVRLAPLVAGIRAAADRAPLSVLMNPEFTREGTAVSDFLNADRIVLGTIADPEGLGVARLRRLYRGIDAPVLVMGGVDAVMTKLAANLFLATKISFANELAGLCEAFGANIEPVVAAMGYDPRIGSAFLRPGVGFGGSCLPNQVAMTVRAADGVGRPSAILAAVQRINDGQVERFVARLASLAGGSVEGRRVAMLGVAFKPHTDDIRDAPSLRIAARLIESGADVVAYDPMERARARAAELVPGLRVVESAPAALFGADVAGLVTEWPEFAALDWAAMASIMVAPRIVDGRNALQPDAMRAAGFDYLDFGRTTDETAAALHAPTPELVGAVSVA